MMPIPPSPKKLFPSFEIRKNGTVTVSLSDLQKLFPSLQITPDKKTVELSIEDVRKLLGVALSGVKIDESWYLSLVPELRRDLQKGHFKTLLDHYILHGYLEGRLPERPIVNERFYLQQNPDIAAAIRAGRIKSGFDHFVRDGYLEGRTSSPDTEIQE
jgi:hypothetical protein